MADNISVGLKQHFDELFKERDLRIQQNQEAARAAVEKALLAEIRIQDQERNARYALKEEVLVLANRITVLEESKNKIYGGILLVALIGIANLVLFFTRQG